MSVLEKFKDCIELVWVMAVLMILAPVFLAILKAEDKLARLRDL